ncbi:hypothetical protein AnigIFM56816_010687 [Aspergillus niger]|nr:hypothetical protein AnigIFM56816_010687 [Aspergillus niger]
MFAIQPAQNSSNETPTDKFTPNILPCRIHHDGPVETLGRYWNPTSDEKDQNLQTAYFRGRKLRGRRVAIPEGYEGVIATPTDRTMPTTRTSADVEVEEITPEEPVKVLEKQGTFDEYVVWGHEFVPAADETFVKGVEEWIKLAEVTPLIFKQTPNNVHQRCEGFTGGTHLEIRDQSGRRIAILGTIDGQQGILIAERAAFATETPEALQAFHAAITDVNNLGDNDIYRWYLASSHSAPGSQQPPDLKINLIWPCTESHIKKYSEQVVRMVTETPEIYRDSIRPYMSAKREEGRLNWVFNILEGRTEQEDVILRDKGHDGNEEGGFLVLPDLNWDRKTMGSLHLLALVMRRDIWSLRDLKKKHIPWLKYLRERLLEETVRVYPQLETDQLKLYVHYQPTYYHFHVHIVNVMLEAGATQATGKAFGLENIISQLETLDGDEEAGMADVSLTYFLGEASELWSNVFGPLKRGEKPLPN